MQLPVSADKLTSQSAVSIATSPKLHTTQLVKYSSSMKKSLGNVSAKFLKLFDQATWRHIKDRLYQQDTACKTRPSSTAVTLAQVWSWAGTSLKSNRWQNSWLRPSYMCRKHFHLPLYCSDCWTKRHTKWPANTGRIKTQTDPIPRTVKTSKWPVNTDWPHPQHSENLQNIWDTPPHAPSATHGRGQLTTMHTTSCWNNRHWNSHKSSLCREMRAIHNHAHHHIL